MLSTQQAGAQPFDIADVETPPADLVLCLDVLFHQASQARHDAVLAKVCSTFTKMAMVLTIHALEDEAPHVHLWDLHWPEGIGVRRWPSWHPDKTLYLLWHR